MTSLDCILAQRRQDVEREFRQARLAGAVPPSPAPKRRSLVSALRRGRPGIIAEIKRRSPSAGFLAEIGDPSRLATALAASGAAAISVVTEPRHFGGTWEDIRRVRGAVDVPVLCKDFILSEKHVQLAAAAGADAVLLIVAALSRHALRRAVEVCHRLQLEALVEVHDEAELDAALACGAQLVGVNNRNLKTLTVDMHTALRLAHRIPAAVTSIAESGYRGTADMREATKAGFHGLLVGEALLRTPDPAAALRGLLEEVTCSA
jgi:indole-3-glycerol phosphate synthase